VTTIAKNQHYVWQSYLKPWTSDGKLFCYRQSEKKLFRPGTNSVATGRYFYQASRLSDVDREYLNHIIRKAGTEELRKLNEGFVDLFQLTFALSDLINQSTLDEKAKAQATEELAKTEKMLGEQYHAGVEQKCSDIIDALKREDDRFYGDAKRCVDFFYYLFNQYFRTRKMQRVATSHDIKIPGHDPERTWIVEAHIYATNVGLAVYAERQAYRIVFLRNDTDVPFITTDQPVINLKSHKDADVEMYYPLSPKLAVVLTKDSEKFPQRLRNVSKIEVETYNYLMYSESDDQIYSNDKDYLESLVSISKNPLI
jgi:hypothetical protein